MTYQQGNTIRLTAQFKDWDGQNVSPAIVKFILYTNKYEKLEEISIANTLPDGLYYYDLRTNQSGIFIYEWYAEIDGTPSLKREKITINTT